MDPARLHRRDYFSGKGGHFPAEEVWRLLTERGVPSHREFAFEFEGETRSRFRSYSSCEEFVQDLIRCTPLAVHVGAFYSASPKHKLLLRKEEEWRAVGRELVFDIDASDYDDVRYCSCKGTKSVCLKCWGFVAAAVEQLQQILTEQFGYKELLWVFSGRRGVHCWVRDESAFCLTESQRRSIADCLSPYHREGVSRRLVPNQNYVHSGVYQGTLFNTALLCFNRYIQQQQRLFEFKERRDTLIQRFVTPVSGQQTATEVMGRNVESLSDFLRLLHSQLGEKEMLTIARELVFCHTFPRIDKAVTASMKHLLKIPYGIHAKTAAICSPLNPDQVSEFVASPTLRQLFGYNAQQANKRKKGKEEEEETAVEEQQQRKRHTSSYYHSHESIVGFPISCSTVA